ncbi:MAG TPA: YfhO family protein [Candidatus Wunengus sp. YC60]|uniref:YfhO family protein n=1 Tax=Candidatus Wunengus sp. YC60 TaxID=3367697 RepID=UPI0040298030
MNHIQNKKPHNYSIPNTTVIHQEVWSKYDWFAILTLFLLTIAYFYNVIIPLDSSVLSDQNTDTRHQLFYWRYFGFNTMAKGIIPLWNPYIYGGTPFVGGLQSAIFYPLNLIFLIFPIHIAINYSIILHVFLSGVFTYLYLRFIRLNPQLYSASLSRSSCLVSSIIFMFCAPQIFHVYPGHLPNLCTMIWLPLILLFSELFIRNRNYLYAFFGGVAVAFNILAGHPQYFFYTAIAVVAYFIIRIIQEFKEHRNWNYAGYHASGVFIIYTIGVLLAAIQLLPAFEMIKYSTRQTLSYEWVGQFSFAPENFITLFIPEFLGDSLKTPYWGRYYLWEMSLYVGILPLMLCAIASFYNRNTFTKTFLIMALITTILALGKFTPLFKILYTIAPGFNMFRGNSKFIFIVAFSLSVLSGFGAEYLRDSIFTKKKISAFLYITLGISAVISLFLLIFFLLGAGYGTWHGIINKICLLGDRYTTLPSLNDSVFLRSTFAIATKSAVKFIILIIISLLVIGLWLTGRLKRQILIPITLALIFGDLWFFGNQYMVTFDSRQCFWNKEMLGVLKNNPEAARITTVGHFELNQGMAHDISNIGGYDANVIKEYSEFINLSDGKPLEEPRIVMEVRQISKLTNLLNLKYILLPANVRIQHPSIKLVYNDSKYALFDNTQALPRTFIVHDAKTLQGRDAIFKDLASSEFDPLKYVILEEPSSFTRNIDSENYLQEPSPTIIEYSPNRVTIRATLFEDGYLVLGDTFYPGWNAYVAGKKSRVFKTDYILRSVFLEKGDHVVKFVYEPKSFTIGMIITLTSMVILIPLSIFCNKTAYCKNPEIIRD